MKKKLPEWVPENAGTGFTTHILPLYKSRNNSNPSIVQKHIKDTGEIKKKINESLSLSEYKEGVLAKDKVILARAITLVESNADKHFDLAQELIKEILPFTGNSIRIGITGVPGAGKSTFIETFGLHIIELGKSPAVLAIDPSSTVSKGSILGDKTRMETLSKNDNAFIRPSPSSGNLGGVTRKTKETLLLCEAAGFDVILIETVGVGQNEVTVRSMVDFFLLMLIAGAGDELQGIKKGVFELADAILINKADGNNIIATQTTNTIYNNTLHYLADATPGWKTKSYTCSAKNNIGIDNIWTIISQFVDYTKKTKIFQDRRHQQTITWFKNMLHEEVLNQFYKKDNMKSKLDTVISEILNQKITPVVGVKKMMS